MVRFSAKRFLQCYFSNVVNTYSKINPENVTYPIYRRGKGGLALIMPNRKTLETISEKARRSIVRMNKIRSKFGLTIEEALILAAVAEANFSNKYQKVGVSTASILSVSEFLNIPYETTRRRMIRLCDRALLSRIDNDGYLIADLGIAREVVDLLAGDPAPTDPESELARRGRD